LNPEAQPTSPATVDSSGIRFPKLYAAIKWGIIATLVALSILAAVFWVMVLGGFAGAGFHAAPRTSEAGEIVVTSECAWPYDVRDSDAMAVCRLFYNMTPEQQAEVLKKREAARAGGN
jgi:hypothetical protein